ncbi:hypothetical protein AERO9AM_10375 [Aeromicrobium sp. 9AM]|nr:hypothetical protein AERO9AM_10375 [Aeromicrobium sp. 9AM]
MDDAVASTQTNLVFEHLNGLEHMNETGSWVHMEVVPAYMRAK